MSEIGTPAQQAAPVVRVRGSATLEVEPELARFTVVVGAQDKDRQLTLERLSNRNEAVRARVREFGDAVEELTSGALHVQPSLRDRRGERVRNYHGQVRLHAAVSDFAALGQLLPELANQELSQVQGPWWRLRTNSDAHVRARLQAVREAVDRARVYAEALGAHLTGVVELADVGLSSDVAHSSSRQAAGSHGAPSQEAGAASFGARNLSAGAADSSPPPLNLEPEQIEASARLEATFTMSDPTDL